jgi:hypothetical protein
MAMSFYDRFAKELERLELFIDKHGSLWPYRDIVILLYAGKLITRDQFIELWERAYGKK